MIQVTKKNGVTIWSFSRGDSCDSSTTVPQAAFDSSEFWRDRWDSQLAEAVERCNGDKRKALLELNKQNPELRRAYVAAINAKARGR